VRVSVCARVSECVCVRVCERECVRESVSVCERGSVGRLCLFHNITCFTVLLIK